MIPMEPGPEDFARILAERRAQPYGVPTPQAGGKPYAHYAHARTGLLMGYLRRLADRIDPTGQQRRNARRSS